MNKITPSRHILTKFPKPSEKNKTFKSSQRFKKIIIKKKHYILGTKIKMTVEFSSCLKQYKPAEDNGAKSLY